MGTRDPKRHLLLITVYLVASLATQATSHFLVAAGHYATIPFLRDPQIVPLGILTMLIQGALLAVAVDRLRPARLADALAFAWWAGLFLVSYIALVEPAKYAAPSIGAWIAVEGAAGFVQFSFYGLLVWAVVRGEARTVGFAAALPPK
jgi:hypothetical protein